MASQVNSQFAYINLINGETVWERLRIVRNFIEDRKIAKKLQKTQEKKRNAILAEIEEAKLTGLQSAILNAEVKLEEYDAHQEQQDDGYKKLDDELAFLEEYEAALAAEAYKTKIEGKTDDEMYQINMATEVYLRNLKKIETEQVARIMGISQATAEEAMRIPQMRQQLLLTADAVSQGLALPEGALDLTLIPLSVQEVLKLEDTLLLK